MANRKDLISGSVMEIPLDKNKGYAYVKLIQIQKLSPDSFGTFIVKVYDKFSAHSIEKGQFYPKEFETDNLLVYPLLLNNFPPLRGEIKWKLLGYSGLTIEDGIIPDYILDSNFGGISKLELKEMCIKSKYGCGIIRNFENKAKFTRDFDSVCHLGIWSHYSSHGLRMLLTMIWIVKNGSIISDIYSDKDFQNNYWGRIFKDQVLKREIDFRKVPRKNRFRAKITNLKEKG